MSAETSSTRKPAVQHQPFTKSTLWRLFGFLKPKRLQYFIGLFCVASINAAERLFTAYIVKSFIDSITGKDLNLLSDTVLYWLLFNAGMLIVLPFFSYLWRSSIVSGIANLRQAVFSHLQHLPLGYYELRHSGEAMSLMTNDISAAELAFQDNFLTLVSATLQGISGAIFMLLLQWDLGLLIILTGTVPLIVNAYYAKPLRLIGDETQQKLAGLSERMGDLLAGFQVVRTFSLGEWILHRFSSSNQAVLGTSLKRVRIESNLAAANDFSGFLSIFPYFVAMFMVIQGKTTLGTLIALVQLNNQIQFFMYSMGGTISRIQGSLAAADRILAVLDAPAEPERYPALEAAYAVPVQLDAQVKFENVHFRYSDDRPTLQGISFAVQPGQLSAFVGPSGSGKSTIFRLLMGHYPFQSGQITVLGKPIHAYTLFDLRELFAFVPQDAYLYTGTIFENIRYGKMDASEAEISAAAQAAYAHDFIQELPDGYQSLVGERGTRLSGGQRQRIAIARALLKNAPILLLDEATSALDSESEELVQRALAVLMGGRTTLAIAHRLSTIENANIIYVVEKGRVVEQGKHPDLIKQGGLYTNLYALQFREPTAAQGSVGLADLKLSPKTGYNQF
jgi:ATP-binding cassette, subfamily B, bacterial